MTQIAVLVGSLRQDSWNKKFAQEIEKRLPEGVSFVYGDLQLPLYNHDDEAAFPDEATRLKQLIETADGVLIVTPEYNRSIPGVLKNAIDWASRPHGSNSFNGKPTVIAGVSVGPIGTAVAQSDLRNILLYLNTRLMGQPEAYLHAARFFDESGALAASSEEFIQAFIGALVRHIAPQA